MWFVAAIVVLASAGKSSDLRRPACSANSKCLGLTGDCCPTPAGRLLDCCADSTVVEPTETLPSEPVTGSHSAEGLGPACAEYLQDKNLRSPEELAARLQRCTLGTGPGLYSPKPEPDIPGATDTTNLQCQYNSPFGQNSMCCGWRPHFNWVVGTCERNSRIPNASFCDGVPSCAREPQINYAAAYQYNGSHFIMQDASTAGDISASGVAGSFKDKTGWESVKSQFRWEGGEGDWPTKYAPWGLGAEGPRGLTPPAALWVLSVDSFYYGTLYMLSQLTLNAQGHKEHNNCWEWEFDAIEGLLGTIPKGSSLPGNLNQLYVTATAQVTGCMPMPGTAAQDNGRGHNFSQPHSFENFCRKNPKAVGCQPWTKEGAQIWHGGGHQGTDRFENLEHTPYVFAVVLDQNGFWVYRWRPDDAGATGWPGISQTHAARVLPNKPRKVVQPSGLKTDVAGDTQEAVILIPSLLPEAACTRSSPERVDFRWGAGALGSMGYEMNPPGQFQGAQNWWAHFADTHQLQNYPLSIAGVPTSEEKGLYSCKQKDSFGSTCNCKYGSSPRRAQSFLPSDSTAGPHRDVAMMLWQMLR